VRVLRILVAVISLGLTSCVQNQAFWDKAGSEPNEFNNVKYSCLQQSQQNASSAYVGKYGGVATSGAITNQNLFAACMNAQGWQLVQVTDIKAYTEAAKSLSLEVRQACSELENSIANKMPCRSDKATSAQMADRSKISQNDKAALGKFRSSITETYAKIADLNRKYYVKNGDAVAQVMELQVAQGNKLASELIEGRISWGEYNRRRFDASKRDKEDLKIAASN
jgi:hypothetical protein